MRASTSFTQSKDGEKLLSPDVTSDNSPKSNSSRQFENYKRQESNPHTISPMSSPSMNKSELNTETRGRRLSNHRLSMTTGRSQIIPNPIRSPVPMNNAEIFDTLEKEQEAMVNKLQREISHLKSERSRSRSQSTSSSSSISRNTSIRSRYSISDAEDLTTKQPAQRSGGSRTSFSKSGSADDNSLIQQLRKENDQLKKKLADLSIRLTEKDHEIEHLSRTVRSKRE